MCANTDVWLDGDFISAFASLVCHNNNCSSPTVPINSGKNVPQLSHMTFPNSVMIIKDYKALPSGVKCIVAVMHTNQHYVVMEITIDTQTIKIFNGLYQPLFDWKDNVIRAMRNCMLVDPCVVPSSAQFNADPAVYQIVGRSRKPQEYVNGYDIIIAMQKCRLDRGYFLHQSGGNNCGPIACMKILDLFHAIDVEGAREVYEKKNICQFVMAEWDRLVEHSSNDLPVFVSEKLIDGSYEICFCCIVSPSMEVIHLPCCKASEQTHCVLEALQSNNQSVYCRKVLDPQDIID